MLSSGVAAAS